MDPTDDFAPAQATSNLLAIVAFWLLVGLPLAWGFLNTLRQALQLLS